MPTYKFTIATYPSHPNKRIKILTGQQFGKLTVIGFAGIDACDLALWHCLCECGNGITVRGSHLRRGTRHSCGCLHKNATPCSTQSSPERYAFLYARARCNRPTHREYIRYGGRGIQFHFTSFDEFLLEIGPRPSPQHSLDRIDNDGHYEKGNVRWATKLQQDTNRRTNRKITAFGITQCLSEWEQSPISARGRVSGRLQRGWCVECAVSLPVSTKCPHIRSKHS